LRISLPKGAGFSYKSLLAYFSQKNEFLLTISSIGAVLRVDCLTADPGSWSLGLVGTSVVEALEGYFLEPRFSFC